MLQKSIKNKTILVFEIHFERFEERATGNR